MQVLKDLTPLWMLLLGALLGFLLNIALEKRKLDLARILETFKGELAASLELQRSAYSESLEQAKHEWQLRDQLKVLLSDKRIDLIASYAERISTIQEKLNPSLHGAYTLAWIGLYQTANNLDQPRIKQAEESSKLLLDMEGFVKQNQLLLGRALVLTWHRHQRALDTLAAYLLDPTNEMSLTITLGEEMELLHNDTQQALEDTIGLAGGALATREELSKAIADGNEKARELFEANKSKYKAQL